MPLVSSEQVWDPMVPACELWSPQLPRAPWQLYCHKLIKLSILTENAPKHTDMRALLWHYLSRHIDIPTRAATLPSEFAAIKNGSKITI